jgi:hypothetical protein
MITKELFPEQIDELLNTLKNRFDINTNRHEHLEWPKVLKILMDNPVKLRSLFDMERSGGEPDVTAYDKINNELVFIDCSPESPMGRRNTCFDHEASESRKENKPENNAMDMASDMGIELLTEEQYRALQCHGTFDIKTSSWIKTPADIRKAGGALFADRRYGHVFVYHNGAPSYYSSRGFRGILRI